MLSELLPRLSCARNSRPFWAPNFRISLALDGTPPTTARHSALGQRDMHNSLTMHALSSTDSEQ
eukprot:12694661-Alexandrium_andersonii.AAC.1